MQEAETEAARTLDSLRELLDTVVVRGVLASTPGDLSALSLHRDSLDQAGAAGLVATLDTLIAALRRNDRSAIPALMATRAKLRLFERLLTLRYVRSAYERAAGADGEADTDEEG